MTDKLIANIEAESAIIEDLMNDNDNYHEIAKLIRTDNSHI